MTRPFAPVVCAALALSVAYLPSVTAGDEDGEKHKLTIDTPAETVPAGKMSRFKVAGHYPTSEGDNVLVGLYRADAKGETTGLALSTADPTIESHPENKSWSAELACDVLRADVKYVLKAELRAGTEVLATSSRPVSSKSVGSRTRTLRR
jgi:hypothetical protein